MTKKTITKIFPIKAMAPKPGDQQDVTSADAYHFCVGSVLGDGSISKNDFNLEIQSKSYTYLKWKRDIANSLGLISIHATNETSWEFKLKECTVKIPATVKKHKFKGKNRDESNKQKKYYYGFSFVTRALFRDPLWRGSFYKKLPQPRGRVTHRKCLPSNIKELFWSDFALAIWYLDDGTYDPAKKTVRISAGEWNEVECSWMVNCLYENFNIKATYYKSHDTPHHFYVNRESYSEFYKRVIPTINDFRKCYPKADISTGIENKLRLKENP